MQRLVLIAFLGLVAWPARSDDVRDQRVNVLRTRAAAAKAKAWTLAAKQGWKPKTDRYELMAIEGGRVWARQVCDDVACVTVAANLAHVSPYNLLGSALTVGMWDQALVRTSHQELAPRATNMESGATAQHATSVAGILAGLGFNAAAVGAAPLVTLQCYEWNNDLAEVTARAMTYPGEPGKLPLSNHSYDYLTGWTYNAGTPTWYGVAGLREDTGFGIYDNTARDLDVIAYNAPYYLHVKSAGNDRGEPAPAPGTPYLYFQGIWRLGFYNPATGPLDDGWDKGGYDTIPHEQNAKDILVVGAVTDADSNGVRSASQAQMTSFSDWGPTDDGRIKPDLVADGQTILTTSDAGDNSYVYESGTSFAAPSVSGVAALLIEQYGRMFAGAWMRASTLKGLLIHTADDLGRPGPDYMFGWGLANAQAAAEHIRIHASDRTRCDIREAALTTNALQNSYLYVRDGTNAVRATLCWTDPPGTANTNNTVLDDPTPRLVHDLDMVLVGSDGVTNRPYVLDPTQPTNNATTGDNSLDNVEQVYVPSTSATGGFYRLVVTMKGALATDRQDYSLLVTGLKRADEVARIDRTPGGSAVTWNAASGHVYTVWRSTSDKKVPWKRGATVTATNDVMTFTDSWAYGVSWYRLTMP